MMRLPELLQGFCVTKHLPPVDIKGLTADSRHVQEGFLFCAYPGIKQDGRCFIDKAIEQGASAILVEANDQIFTPANGEAYVSTHTREIPLIPMQHLSSIIGLLAARFYREPSKQMPVIGITGTNGKTSITHFIARALKLAGFTCGVLGTLGNGIYGSLQQGSHTTPDAITLQRLLADMREQAADYVAMEVSSHALDQGRVNGVEFAIAVFTNLTQDHLDYHGDMDNYAKAKRALFNYPKLGQAILNVDDVYGQKWLQELQGTLPVYAYSLHPATTSIPGVYVHHAQYSRPGFTASISTPWGDGVLHNPYLIGSFNLSNLLVVLIVLSVMGIPLQDALAYLAQLRGVPGRMETLGGDDKPLIVIDYSHTPDALEQVLRELKSHCMGKLWCVFGCGGERDSGKRPVMGQIAMRYADEIVITDDNPRHEDPRKIIRDIISGLPALMPNTVIEHDRRRAIRHAISCAQVEDIILIAGKGHETYQIVGDEKQPFSDLLEVQKILLGE